MRNVDLGFPGKVQHCKRDKTFCLRITFWLTLSKQLLFLSDPFSEAFLLQWLQAFWEWCLGYELVAKGSCHSTICASVHDWGFWHLAELQWRHDLLHPLTLCWRQAKENCPFAQNGKPSPLTLQKKAIKKYSPEFNYDCIMALVTKCRKSKIVGTKNSRGNNGVLILILWWRGEIVKSRSKSCHTMSWSKHNEHVDEYNIKIKKKSKLPVNNKNRSRQIWPTKFFWQDGYDSHLAVKD